MFNNLCIIKLLGNTNEAEVEIKARIVAGNKCAHPLGHLPKERWITHSSLFNSSKTDCDLWCRIIDSDE